MDLLKVEKGMKTIHRRFNLAAVLVTVCAIVLVLINSATIAFAITDDGPGLVGNWTGESICAGNRPACHDEKVIFRITKLPDEHGKVTIFADKVIDGKPEPMWELEFTYDRDKHTLTNEFTRGNTHGLWEFSVKEDTMEGTLVILPDKTIGRRVKVKKDTPNAEKT
jgi:hypothetical protein